MPYSPGGIFSLVASYFANPGTTIRTEQHNPVFEDVGSALSQVLLRDGRAPMTGPLNMNGFPINNVVAGNTPSSVATLAQAVPLGAIMDYSSPTPPSGWMLCAGQEISRSTYAALFAIIGTNFGAGNGTTTFNIPDLRGRVAAGLDSMGGSAAGRLTGAFTAALGLQSAPITQTELPAVGVGVNVTGGATGELNSTQGNILFQSTVVGLQGGGAPIGVPAAQGTVVVSGTLAVTASGATNNLGSGASLSRLQPTLILIKIIKVSYDV